MGCCFGSACEPCEPCCNRVGCSCVAASNGKIQDIVRERRCTDMPMIVIFIGFIIYLSAAIWAPAYQKGDPERILRGRDFLGQVCGKSAAVKDRALAAWPDPVSFRFQVCTSDCGVTNTLWGYSSQPYLNRYCLPNGGQNVSLANFDSTASRFDREIADLQTALPIIGASLGIAFVVAFIFLLFIGMCGGLLIWTTIALLIAGFSLLGYALLSHASSVPFPALANGERALGWIFIVLGGIILCITVFSWKRIVISIKMIEAAAFALGDMKTTMCFPLWPLSLVVGFMFFWIFAAVYMFSAGNEMSVATPTKFAGQSTAVVGYPATGNTTTIGTTFNVINFQDTLQNTFPFHFFFFLWVLQVLSYYTYSVIAGAVADWYFTSGDRSRRGDGMNELSPTPVCDSCCRMTRYHCGTLLFGALVLAIVQMIRYMFRYFERIASGGANPNPVQKCIGCLVDCCLRCLECCLDKLSKNALIYCAITGDPFCPSAGRVFDLLMSNLLQVAAVSFFSGIVTLLGRIVVPLFTTGLAALILVNVEPYKTELSSPTWPIVVIVFMSWFVGTMFLVVFDSAVDTVLLGYLVNPNFGWQELKTIVEENSDDSKAIGTDIQTRRDTFDDSYVQLADGGGSSSRGGAPRKDPVNFGAAV